MDTKELVRAAMEKHLVLAAEYERHGVDFAARQLRAVANLLGAIYQGKEPTTILPIVTQEIVDRWKEEKSAGDARRSKRRRLRGKRKKLFDQFYTEIGGEG